MNGKYIMNMDIRNLRTRWINIDKDTTKAEQMVSLLNKNGFTEHERFPAITNTTEFDITKEKCEWFGTHMCGLSHRKLLKETILNDGKPILILEDDIEVENQHIKFKLSIPDDADAIYFGISQGDSWYSAKPADLFWVKINKIFSTHAILHINPKYSESVVSITENAVKNDKPFDVEIAYLVQTQFKVYTPRFPFFYQADSKNPVVPGRKISYETLTRVPLIMDNEMNSIKRQPNTT